MTEEKEYLRIPGHMPVKEAAALLGLSEERVLQHVRARHLPSRKVDGRYMIPAQAVEEFHRKPHGRIRTTPAPWRIYRAGARVHQLLVEVPINQGQEQAFNDKLHALLDEQRHLFPGTMQRSISTDDEDKRLVSISLTWKDTELTDEDAFQNDFAAFKTEFADLLDWENARYAKKQALIYT